MQNYNRVYDYIYEYWKRVYDTYSKHALSYLVTYYQLDLSSTVWDNEELMSGSYEKFGSLSGMRWKKICYLPVFFTTEITTDFEAKDEGYVNEGDVEFVIPSTYGFTPHVNDIIVFDCTFLDTNPILSKHDELLTVTGAKRQSPYDRTYWYLYAKGEQSRTIGEIEKQVSETCVFFEYTKNTYNVNDAITLTESMIRNKKLTERVDSLYSKNSGLFLL